MHKNAPLCVPKAICAGALDKTDEDGLLRPGLELVGFSMQAVKSCAAKVLEMAEGRRRAGPESLWDVLDARVRRPIFDVNHEVDGLGPKGWR